jgi:hypothetical protein
MELKITQHTELTINIELPLYFKVDKGYMTTFTAVINEKEAVEVTQCKDGSLFYVKKDAKNVIPQKYDEITREEFMVFADKAISDTYDAYENLFDTAKHIEAVKAI